MCTESDLTSPTGTYVPPDTTHHSFPFRWHFRLGSESGPGVGPTNFPDYVAGRSSHLSCRYGPYPRTREVTLYSINVSFPYPL